MPRYKRLDQKKIFDWKSDEILYHLATKGLDNKDIESVRSEKTIFNRLIAAGELFRDKEFFDFTGIDLGFVLYHEKWESEPLASLSKIYGALSDNYRGKKPIKNELGMPYIHMLRIQTGNNRSNLHRLRGYEIQENELIKVSDEVIYPGVKASTDDYREGICLPLPGDIDLNVKRLFGYTWANGTVVRDNKNNISLRYHATKKQQETLEEKVVPLAEKIFNVRFNLTDQRVRKVNLGGMEAELGGVAYERGSIAITTFLVNEHNFPKPGNLDRPDLPNIGFDGRSIDEYLSAIIELKGTDVSFMRGESFIERMEINGLKEQFAYRIGELLGRNNHSFSGPFKQGEGTDKYKIVINKEPTTHFKHLNEDD